MLTVGVKRITHPSFKIIIFVALFEMKTDTVFGLSSCICTERYKTNMSKKTKKQLMSWKKDHSWVSIFLNPFTLITGFSLLGYVSTMSLLTHVHLDLQISPVFHRFSMRLKSGLCLSHARTFFSPSNIFPIDNFLHAGNRFSSRTYCNNIYLTFFSPCFREHLIAGYDYLLLYCMNEYYLDDELLYIAFPPNIVFDVEIK